MNSRRDCLTSVIKPIQEVSLSMNKMYTCLLELPYPLWILGEEDYPSVVRVVCFQRNITRAGHSQSLHCYHLVAVS